MSIAVQLSVRGNREAISRVMEALNSVSGLHGQQGTDSAIESIALPEWLTGSFGKKLSAAENEQWLAEWRAAAPAVRLEMERRRGWEKDEWLHWFTADNEFWSIAQVRVETPSRAVIELAAVDYVVPVAALEWLGELVGAEVSCE